MKNRKCVIAKRSKIKWLVVMALFALIATNLFCYNTGDYRTKWGGNFEDLNLWECYNGSNWITATQLPSSPFVNTLYISKQTITMYSSIVIEGGIFIDGTLQLVSGANLTINPSVTCQIGKIEVYRDSKLINNGSINANENSSSITIMNDGTLENNGIITNSGDNKKCSIILNSRGLITFGSQGIISGNYSFSAGYASTLATANPQGLDGSIACSGKTSYDQPYLIYHGTEPQKTGLQAPDKVLGIDFNNPAGVSLSNNIHLVDTAIVHSGATLNFGTYIIDSAWYGSGTFSMEDGSTIVTANTEGFSSTGKTGSVQVGTRNYNSNGNYIFNGTQFQQTGNFNPAPISYTVNDIIFDNPAGVTFTDPITVLSNMELLQGDVSYNVLPQGVDGYYSPDVKRIVISKNGTLMYRFTAQSLPYPNGGAYINRKWIVKGNFNGSKLVTLYWTETDDNNFNWNIHNFPKVYVSNSDEPLVTIWNPLQPRRISFIAHNFPNTKDDVFYYIGRGTDDTLPVTLSSFIVSQSGVSSVKVSWTTQSETNVMGFNIYRSTQSDISTSINLGCFILAANTSQIRTYQYIEQVPANGIYYYWLEIVDFNGSNSFYGPAIVEIINIGNNTPPIPVKEGFHSIAPNPLDSNARIFYGIPSKSLALIQVYNLKGQKVRTILNETKDSGNFDLNWDARDDRGNILANGNYVLRLDASGKVWTKKITILH